MMECASHSPDLLLVNPNAKATYGSLSELSAIEPPLWCALLAAYVRQRGYSVAILDAEAEGFGVVETTNRVIDINPLLTAIIVLGINPSVSSTPKMDVVISITHELKRQSPTKVLISGLHPSALPEITLQETGADFVCQGEGFKVIVRLIELLKGQQEAPYPFFTNYSDLVDINNLPMPAWDLLPMDKYRAHNWHCLDCIDQRSPYAVVATSYGCPYSCTYCNVHTLYDGKPGIRYRDPEKVAAEVDFLARHGWARRGEAGHGRLRLNLKFADEIFGINPRHVIAVCEAIAALGYNINAWAYGRPDTLTDNMAEAMYKAGIRWLCFGFESASKTVREGVAKRYAQQEIDKAVGMCRDVGINVIGNLMVGLPDDNFETMQATLDMAKYYNFEWLNIYACAAYPGSQLYEDAQKQGIKLPEKWGDYSQFSPGFIPLPTKYISSEEVLMFRDNAFREYFSRPEYLKMIEGKFGVKAREHIEEMLKVKVERR